jgi:hypothetical protein
MNKKVIKILEKLYNVVVAEEAGSAEHITEHISSTELEEVFDELGVEIKSNFSNKELDEIVDDIISDEDLETFDENVINEILEDSDLNRTARKKALKLFKKKLSK